MATKSSSEGSDIRSLNIYQKLSEITGKIGVVDKGGKNTEQNYAFIEYAAVAGKLRALFSEYGVLVIPRMPKNSEHVREEITTKYGNKGVAILIDFTFEIVNADSPDDKFEVTWTGEAADYGDKGTNKAATSALKYYLMRQFNISEKGEDNDEHSIDRGAVDKNQPAAPTKPKPVMISKATITEIQTTLAEKGIEIDDVDDTIKKLAKVEDITKINAASGKAILEKIKKANSQSLREFVYGPDQIGDDGNSPQEDENSTEVESDGKDELEDESEPPIEVNAEMKDATEQMYKELPIKEAYRIRFLKDVTGAITLKSLKTDKQWRDLYDRCGAILSGDEELKEEWKVEVDPEQEKLV